MNKSELILAITGIVLQICLLLLLLKLRSYRQFPFFFAYVGFSALSATLTVAARNHAALYFYAYCISDALYVVLTFFVLQESFRSVFRNFYSLRWFKLSFPATGILIIVVALLRAIFFPPADSGPLVSTLFSFEIAVGFLQFGVFCLFIVLVRFFHMRARQYAFGIVLGFGIAAAGSLVAFLLRSEFGTTFDQVLRILSPVSYIIGVGIWLVIFLRAESVQPARGWDSDLTPEQLTAELRRYTKSAKGILGR